MSPFFSIIIPVFNVENYLSDCLNSVINQNIQDFEIICVNDGSTDNSIDVLKQFASDHTQIRIVDQNNQGLSAARNSGIKASRGEYLFFLDSDDWMQENTLEVLTNLVKNQDLICFDGRKIFEDGTEDDININYYEDNISGWEYYNKYITLKRNMHFDCAVTRLYKKAFIINNKLFFKEGFFHEDSLFTPIVCYYASQVTVISGNLYVYRVREGSITKSKNKKRLLDRIRIANILSDFFIPMENIEKKAIYREIAGLYFGLFNPKVLNRHELSFTDLRKTINWHNFKKVSIYPRHKRIYSLIWIHPWLYYLYVHIENISRILTLSNNSTDR